MITGNSKKCISILEIIFCRMIQFYKMWNPSLQYPEDQQISLVKQEIFPGLTSLKRGAQSLQKTFDVVTGKPVIHHLHLHLEGPHFNYLCASVPLKYKLLFSSSSPSCIKCRCVLPKLDVLFLFWVIFVVP